MNSAAARTNAPPPVVFRDAFGERRRIAAPTGNEAVDVLCLRNELTAVPSFEFALRERVSRLASFRHPYFAQVRTVERLNDTARTLTLISNAKPGVRLSDLLTAAAKHDLVLDIDSALCIVRQLVTAMATFHEQADDVAHGALGPERIVITPNARLLIVEHVMGTAVEQLQFSEDRYWRELRVPCPRSAGLPVMDQRADVLQVGMVALALILRRLLHADELPSSIGDAVVSARAISAAGDVEALPSGLRPWLTSALQLDPRAVFPSAIEAREELEKVFDRNDDIGAPSALEAFLARYHERVGPAAELAAPHQVVVKQAASEPPPPEPVAQRIAPPPAPPEPIWTVPERTSPEPIWTAPEPTPPEPLWSAPEAAPPEPIRMLAPDLEPIAAVAPAPAHRAPSTATPTPASPPRALSSHAAPAAHTPLFEYDPKDRIDMLPSSARKRGRSRVAVAALVLLSLVGGGTLVARRFFVNAPASATGTVTVTTNPPGAQVLIDGQPQGVSPTMLTVPAGDHVLELRGAGEPRTISLSVAAGAQLSQYIELGKGATTVGSGSLQVRTEPAGARISVDGVGRGTSPVTVTDLSPGEHTVIVETEAGSTKQTVTVEAGTTASLVAQLPVAAGGVASGGWISVSAPRTVQLYEEGRLIGSSDSERLMLPAGTHQIEIVNEALGYRNSRTIQVVAGKVSPLTIEFPKGTIALNATPWAEVWIDGERIGETPIGNLPVTLGAHEIIFRHPDLGEQRHVTNVTLAATTRLSVDMRKRP